MKKLLLALMLFFGCMIISNAQPANDECITAQNLGNLPAPAACPSGVGPILPVAGTIVGATEANPYIFQNGCSGAGGPNMGVPANDVWYSFVATGYQAVITVNSTFANPNIAMYSGTCGALGGGVGGCAVGAGGTVTLTVEQLFPGTTYYVQVSGNTGQSGTFNMSIRNNRDCADCLISSNLVVNPPPVNGSYQPGQVVNFCYTVNDYSQINTNWFHGVQITYGAGWAGISGQVPAAAIGGAGAWGWYPSCTQSIPPFQAFGQGFYIDLDGDGNPGNNFGDNCDLVGTGIPCPGPASWTFCWNMTVAAGCSPGSNLSVTVNTSGDGESGSWNNLGCVDDPPSIAPAIGACCPPNMAAVNISCPGMSDGQATATPVGATGPYEYSWAGPGGYVNSASGVPGANTISGLSTSGVYTVSVTDNNNCLTTATVTVNIGAAPAPAAANTGPYCEGATINLSVGAGYVDWDWLGPSAYNQANTQNPTLALATPAMAGVYTVTVSDAIGCSATATVNVTVNALPPAVAGNNGPVCSGTDIGLTSGGGLQYSWIGPGGYADPVSQNPIIVAATPANSGVYTVTVTDGNLCSATATTTLVINALPVVNANTNTPICNGNNINLTSNGAVNYDWVGPNAFVSAIQNPVIAGASAINNGTYTVTGTDANGCTASATVNVTTFPNPTALFVGNPLLGCAPLCVDLTDQSAGNGGVINNWSWNVEGQNPSASQNVNYCFNNPGIYDASLTVTTADGCSSTLSFPNYITVSPNPVASFIYTPQIIMELHPDVTFASNSIGVTNWLWDFGDGSFSNVENPIHAYQDTGIFCITLLVSNNAGCTDTTIGCLYIQPEYSLYIPNTFTVNGDGLNEMWQLYGRGIKKLEVRIFDRWGEELYFFDDLAKGWPGTRQNGSVCKQDVYVFRVEVTDPSNTTHVILGNVNLIR